MTRLRTHNNRRRSRRLKEGGLLTLRYSRVPPFLTWGELNSTPAEILEQFRVAVLGEVARTVGAWPERPND